MLRYRLCLDKADLHFVTVRDLVRDASRGNSTEENLPCAESQKNGDDKCAIIRPIHAVSQKISRRRGNFATHITTSIRAYVIIH
jgi:hypothetical protein